MSVKLIAIDLDGTLLNSHHQVSDRIKTTIAEAKSRGIQVVLASGRPYAGIKQYLAELELNRREYFCISNNGSVVHQADTGEHLTEFLLDFKSYQELELLSRQIDISMHALANNAIFTANKKIGPYTVHESYLTQTPLIYCPVDEMNPNLSFTKIMLSGLPEQLSRAESKIPADFYQKYTLVKSTPFFLECLNLGANKGIAMQVIADKLNINYDEMMCIGDQNNDLPMFDYAKHKIAMGNAADAIKDKATFVTKSNDEDGVAVAIEKFIS
ncbi:sugar-phosphatase [Orbus sturtevantii]|uniref:sugar-phosphatase n=1 Tax=Orbus sturtevantii TaxID=3074109 RepID=UPI00370D0511